MSGNHREQLRKIKSFPSLVKYLRDELDWPIETEDFDDLTFDYEPEELGIDPKTAAKIDSIKQLRPLTSDQPWGIFFVKFEPKRLPVVALRRILGQLVFKKRASANRAERPSWNLHDLLFISAYGEGDDRQVSLAHFSEDSCMGNLATLKVLGWDGDDTGFHLDHVHKELHEKLRWPGDANDSGQWRDTWSAAFTLRHREVITTSQALAIQLADLARKIRVKINAALAVESAHGKLTKLMTAFRESLIHDLKPDDFADMYAQTIAYGLLSARVSRSSGGLVADDIGLMAGRTSPFLSELLATFLHVGGRKRKANGEALDFDELGINDVVEMLREANMEAVLRDFDNRNPEEDPVIHFYELFLKEYDAEKRMQRGVFYTPKPIVSYIVRSVHELLQTEFGLADGLADTSTWGDMLKRHPDLKLPPLTDEAGETRSVSSDEPFIQILDPATGTATFLVEVIEVIHQTLVTKWKKSGLGQSERKAAWNDYVPKHLLPRLYGFELLMAPYTIAHMKVALKLADTGYRFDTDEPTRIYLTNTLEPWVRQLPLVGFDALAHEAATVNEIKRDKRFTVIIGNPPYARISSNMGEWISKLIEDFKYVDGVHFGEVKHWLHDDYVKFVRIAFRLVAQASVGIVGMITNRGYLSGPTFRGMRNFVWRNSSLLRVLDLHGGAIQEEHKPPSGMVDENVFDIKQGVAIVVSGFGSRRREDAARVYAEFWGDRQTKYKLLDAQSAISVEGSTVCPMSPSVLS